MKQIFTFTKILPLIALVIGGTILIRFVRNVPEPRPEPPHLQCAHWSVFRSCQLLGVPVGMDYLIKKLPYQEQGHSMLQMPTSFKKSDFKRKDGGKISIQLTI
ncbi:MAG: hypothetical protein LBT05_13150 [Planctomycetaceae bacterium]|jgi:hypothetical protein|nr:hypothetical protein [Planctomycetaceae bacterium]